jgi:hypothetical protein
MPASDRIFGEIQGVPPGTLFPNRAALSAARVHRPTQAGISGSAHQGADSIVVSGGYEDDEDLGDVIIYTGHGGRAASGWAVADQQLVRGNLALAPPFTPPRRPEPPDTSAGGILLRSPPARLAICRPFGGHVSTVACRGVHFQTARKGAFSNGLDKLRSPSPVTRYHDRLASNARAAER